MSISAANLKPLKTPSQKALQALNDDLGIGIGTEEAARRQAAPPKPKGQKPLYHSYFGPYFFWVVTGRGKSEIYGASAEEYYGQTRYQQHFGSITRWITELLNADKEELSFNQYAYLKDLLQKHVGQFRDDAPNFQGLVEWLQEQADRADIYASVFFPLRYNVRTLLDAGERDLNGPLNLARELAPDEQERLEYYQLIEKRRAELAEDHLILCEQSRAENRASTDEEISLLSRLERQLEFLALNQLNQLDYNRLQARANRKQDAAEFKAALEERLLQPSPSGLDVVLKYPGSFQPGPDDETGVFRPRIIFTLSELTREFDANIELCDTPSSRATYAAEQLRLFDANLPYIISHFNPYLELDNLKLTALNDVLKTLRANYEQHQKQKLQMFGPAIDKVEIAKFNRLRPYPAPIEKTALSITVAVDEIDFTPAMVSVYEEEPAIKLKRQEETQTTNWQDIEEAFKSEFINGYSWKFFTKLIGPDGCNIYDIRSRKPQATSTSKEWAEVYWALYRAGCIRKLSERKVEDLFRKIAPIINKAAINRSTIKDDEATPARIANLIKSVEDSRK